jgi:hypothetical protein
LKQWKICLSGTKGAQCHLRRKTGHQAPEVRHVIGSNKYYGSNKPLASICHKKPNGDRVGNRYGPFELGSKTYGSTGADGYGFGQRTWPWYPTGVKII